MFRLLALPLFLAVPLLAAQSLPYRHIALRQQTADSVTVVVSWTARNADSVRIAFGNGVTRTRGPRGRDSVRVARPSAPTTFGITLTPLRGSTAGTVRPLSLALPVRPQPAPSIDSAAVDTATVVTPSAFTPNLPAGMRFVCDGTFANGTPPCGLTINNFQPNGGSVVETPGAPFAARSFQMRFPAGDIGGAGGPASLAGPSGQRWTALYVAVSVRLSPNYVMHANEEKFFYPRLSGGASPAALNLAWRPVGAPASSGIGWNAKSWRPEGGGINVFSEPQANGPTMARGVWHTVEVLVRLNTPGQYNGVLQTWLDGVPQLDRRTVRFYADAEPRVLDQILFDATRGGGTDAGSAVPADGMTRWINRLAFYAGN
jgi:hypothetical protein